MKRVATFCLIAAVPLAALAFWVARNTSWVEQQVPLPLRGEARANPFYAAQRLTEALGARSTWDRVFTTPPPNAVIVLTAWHWSLSTPRRLAIERWVEAGGRLVVDDSLIGGEEELERWSRIVRHVRPLGVASGKDTQPALDDDCVTLQPEGTGAPADASDFRPRLCDGDGISSLNSQRMPTWALRDASGIQVMRVAIGRGSVTRINATPFRYRSLFDGDHGWLLVAATQLHRGDEVHFLSEDHPSLLALLWRYGAPALVLALTLVVLVLWRDAARFGPLAAPRPSARRSLAEQIAGTGRFIMRHGSGDRLHAAARRALDEAAVRRIRRYAHLPADERTAALARFVGVDQQALADAVRSRALRPHELRAAIALLERARRHTLDTPQRSSHGTD